MPAAIAPSPIAPRAAIPPTAAAIPPSPPRELLSGVQRARAGGIRDRLTDRGEPLRDSDLIHEPPLDTRLDLDRQPAAPRNPAAMQRPPQRPGPFPTGSSDISHAATSNPPHDAPRAPARSLRAFLDNGFFALPPRCLTLLARSRHRRLGNAKSAARSNPHFRVPRSFIP
jgi:hypothetical protein